MKPPARALALTTLLVGAFASSAAAQGPTVGEVAPEIELTAVLHGEDREPGVDLASLRGRVVVLEFWATWCSPCIPGLDHLAEVASDVAAEPVTFLAITDESEEDVRWFLDRRPTTLPIALDADRATFDAYRPPARPHTVIVGSDGRVVANTLPQSITAEALRAILAGDEPDGLEPAYQRRGGAGSADRVITSFDDLSRSDLLRLDSLTTYKAVMRPTENHTSVFWINKPGSVYTNRRMIAGAFPMLLLRWASDAMSIDFDDRAGLPEESWFADVIVPPGQPDLRMLKAETVRLVETTFGVRARRETRRDSVYRLVRLRDQPLGFEHVTEAGRLMIQGSRISAEGQPFRMFLDYLAGHLDRSLVDETGLDEGAPLLYDFEMRFAIGAEGALEEGLRDLGLALIAEDDYEAEVLIVEAVRE